MKALKKILLIAVILVVVLGIAAVVFVGVFFDKIVKKGIEQVAPTITQTTVTVDSVHIGALSGSASINGFAIGNPNPLTYKSTNAISLGKAAVSVVPGSILSDKIVIRSIEVRAPEITLEGNPFGVNNLKQLLDNVNAAAGTVSANTNKPTATPAEKKAAKKLQVDDFLISGAKVTARITGLDGEPFSVVIPDIHFTNLGTGPDGITVADLTQKILNEIITDSLKVVGERAKDLIGKNAGAALQGAAQKAMGDNGDKLKKGIGNLFGK
ncbi:MAG TPA: AsmA family protein [Verrucomicrobiae bacterium]|nr:AsmA family protein [Verrucomicrobiae bacterium]